MRFWRRGHRHRWSHAMRFSGAAMVARYEACDCGAERGHELTEAGQQQLGWWRMIFPERQRDRITTAIGRGALPYPLTAPWVGGRLLTRQEALAEIAGRGWRDVWWEMLTPEDAT